MKLIEKVLASVIALFIVFAALAKGDRSVPGYPRAKVTDPAVTDLRQAPALQGHSPARIEALIDRVAKELQGDPDKASSEISSLISSLKAADSTASHHGGRIGKKAAESVAQPSKSVGSAQARRDDTTPIRRRTSAAMEDRKPREQSETGAKAIYSGVLSGPWAATSMANPKPGIWDEQKRRCNADPNGNYWACFESGMLDGDAPLYDCQDCTGVRVGVTKAQLGVETFEVTAKGDPIQITYEGERFE